MDAVSLGLSNRPAGVRKGESFVGLVRHGSDDAGDHIVVITAARARRQLY
jgi:hypothetical protein